MQKKTGNKKGIRWCSPPHTLADGSLDKEAILADIRLCEALAAIRRGWLLRFMVASDAAVVNRHEGVLVRNRTVPAGV